MLLVVGTMKILLLLAGLASLTTVESYVGEHVGDFQTFDHEVSGSVFIVNETRIRIQNFTHDGNGPDVFFYFGKKNGGPATPAVGGTFMMDQYGRDRPLDAYWNADIVLTLPGDATVNNIAWLSVWCRQFEANFAQLIFPNSLTVPANASVGSFVEKAHDVRSGAVTVLDMRRIHIEELYYDGLGPDSFFWVGTGSLPDSSGQQIPNEEGSMAKLLAYNGDTITLTLPLGVTVDDIDYLSIWCRSAESDFGHVLIGNNLQVPPYTMHIEPYNGKLLGDLKELAHDVTGTVYLVDSRHLRITNFYYDGLGPDAHVWIGDTEIPDDSGTMLPVLGYEDREKLPYYSNGDIVVSLPSAKSLSDFTWISIWCVSAKVDFGHILVPKNFDFGEPLPQNIGEFTTKAHNVKSDEVTVLNTKTIRIENFHYDGRGPDAFFFVGTGDKPKREDGVKIPDEAGSLQKAGSYNGDTIELTLPDDLTFMDIDWLSMYCISFSEDFGHILIPDNLNIPGDITIDTKLANCEQMDEDFNVAWEIVDDYIHFEFTGALGPFRYMAFGLSGSDSNSVMGGGDVVVASYNSGGPQAEDFLLNQYSQCSGQTGVCTDEVQGGQNDIEEVEGFQVDGVTTVKFKRKINTGDSKDKEYSGEKYIIWAMGNINQASLLVTKHDIRLTGNKMIDFDRVPYRACTTVVGDDMTPEADPWTIPPLYGLDVERFDVCIGPAGPQENGYTAITGVSSWGIAWYVNGWLIPEIRVERGETYTFHVSGGNDPSNPAQHHPFYITDDPEGGFAAKTDAENSRYTIFAGPEDGRYCEFKTTSTSSDNTDSFQDYNKTLNKECSAGDSGILTWTPNNNTPKEVYYQCYTHKFLGWKIKVMDKMVSGSAQATPHVYIMAVAVLAIFTLLKAM